MADTAVQQSPNLAKTPTKGLKKKTPVSEETKTPNMPSKVEEASTGKLLK